MTMKLIIWVPGKPLIHGFVRREFKWSEKHKCYIHGGKEYTPEEFNAVAPQAFSRGEDMHPCAKAIVEAEAAPKAAPPPAPVTTISAKEITEDDAVAVLMRIAPHRLRRGPGRPPAQEKSA